MIFFRPSSRYPAVFPYLKSRKSSHCQASNQVRFGFERYQLSRARGKADRRGGADPRAQGWLRAAGKACRGRPGGHFCGTQPEDRCRGRLRAAALLALSSRGAPIALRAPSGGPGRPDDPAPPGDPARPPAPRRGAPPPLADSGFSPP